MRGTIERAACAAIETAITDADIAARWVETLDASEKTRETYSRSIRQWLEWLECNSLCIMAATRQTVLDYKRALEHDGKKAATVNAYLTAVRRLYAWLESEGIKANVAASVKGERRGAASPRDALTVEQGRGIVADAPGEGATLEELRDYALVNLLMRRGLRTVEAARADIGDIRQIGGQAVLYLWGKGYGDKADFVVLDDACLQPLYRYLEARGDKDSGAPLFAGHGNRNRGGRLTTRTISRICKECLKAHGLEAASLTAHSLRHTAVTFALIGGAELQEVQAMARHRSIETTMVYAHNLHRMDAGAERAVDSLLS